MGSAPKFLLCSQQCSLLKQAVEMGLRFQLLFGGDVMFWSIPASESFNLSMVRCALKNE